MFDGIEQDDMKSDTLEAQVVQVVLPDGDVEARLASLDSTSSSLVLKQVNLGDGGEVQVGGQAVVKLSSIGHANASGKIVYLRAGGPSGPVLLELHFDSTSVAKLWAGAFGGKVSPTASPARSTTSPAGSPARSPAGGRGKPVSSGRGSPSGGKGRDSPAARGSPSSQGRGAGRGGGARADVEESTAAATATLRELVRQQEEQVRLLQEITSRKDEQLLKIQERLEDSLNMLQAGQETYAKQGQLVAEQTKTIEQLRGQLEGADNIVAACNANAAQAAAGRAAAKQARSQADAGPANAPSALARALAATCGGQATGRAPSPGSSPGAKAGAKARAAAAAAAAGRGEEQEDESDRAAILSKLQALEAEKGQHEADLAREQHAIFAELQALQGMMAELGLDLNAAMPDEAE